eukprot:TRINITY_DN13322_c0_g1_i6.p1 TRINITY_DN13322_c0_g1~~TRINITY_DN13322_c0_g1_i6.p1  ORF type:complete len:294 (+),score=34.13 TRINITY_DN13322_c0_g1_i6:73-954(+)
MCIRDRGRIYSVVGPKNESLKELVGALSILCSGNIKEKTALSLSLISGRSNGLSLDNLVTYLVSAYKVLLEKSESTVKITNITPEELAVMTAQQCFEDNNKACTQSIAIEEFMAWFSSQTKTLIPQVHRSHPSKASQDSYCIEQFSTPNLQLFNDQEPDNENTPQPAQNCPKPSHYPEPSIYTFRNLCGQPGEMQEQWEQFLIHYYSMYGFYPPPPPALFGVNNDLETLKSVEASRSLLSDKRNNACTQCRTDKSIFRTYINSPKGVNADAYKLKESKTNYGKNLHSFRKHAY